MAQLAGSRPDSDIERASQVSAAQKLGFTAVYQENFVLRPMVMARPK